VNEVVENLGQIRKEELFIEQNKNHRTLIRR
jgi:hypothetical protein